MKKKPAGRDTSWALAPAALALRFGRDGLRPNQLVTTA